MLCNTITVHAYLDGNDDTLNFIETMSNTTNDQISDYIILRNLQKIIF